MSWLFPPIGPITSGSTATVYSQGALFLERLLNTGTGATPENLILRVFKNNITPASTMTVADFAEATFAGYVAVTLTSADWTISHDGTFGFATASSGVMFASSATTDETVYGYYMTGVNSSTLYWAQAFPAAFRVYNLGDAVVPTSALQLGMP